MRLLLVSSLHTPTHLPLLDWSIQMPIKNLLEDVFSTALDHVAVARDYLVKVPASNLPSTLIETLTVPGACSVPKESLLPRRRSHCILQSNE